MYLNSPAVIGVRDFECIGRAIVEVNQWQPVGPRLQIAKAAAPLLSQRVAMPKRGTPNSAALATGAIAFVLILLLGVRTNSPGVVGPLILASVPAGLLAIWIATRATSVRAAWGRGCFVNGLLSLAVGIGFWIQEEPGSGRPGYSDDLERAIGPLVDFIWPLVAWAGFAALILAGILLALSWWLLGPPHRHA